MINIFDNAQISVFNTKFKQINIFSSIRWKYPTNIYIYIYMYTHTYTWERYSGGHAHKQASVLFISLLNNFIGKEKN